MLEIGIDWNNTIQNQIAQIIARSQGRLVTEDFDEWDVNLSQKMGMASRAEYLAWAWGNPAIQETAPPFPGVKAALDNLAEFAKIKIITASPLPLSKIIKWFDRYQIPFGEIIPLKDKRRAPVDLLIDDSPEALKTKHPFPLIKFELGWNREIELPSFDNWADFNIDFVRSVIQ